MYIQHVKRLLRLQRPSHRVTGNRCDGVKGIGAELLQSPPNFYPKGLCSRHRNTCQSSTQPVGDGWQPTQETAMILDSSSELK